MKKPALQFFVYLLIFSLYQTAYSQGNSIKSFTQNFDKKEGLSPEPEVEMFISSKIHHA